VVLDLDEGKIQAFFMGQLIERPHVLRADIGGCASGWIVNTFGKKRNQYL
jgi:hypothetical protein